MEIEKTLQRWSELYYAGIPEVTNEEYDAVEQIHGQIIQGLGDIPHAFRMYSLKKHYRRDGAPPISGDLVETDKLDGAALALTYVRGKLVRALTRGNGILGMDVTDNVRKMPSVPKSIHTKKPITQITGEVVALESMENSRNYASGALKQQNDISFKLKLEQGKMRFFAYNIQDTEEGWGVCPTYLEDLGLLMTYGFYVATDCTKGYPKDGRVYRFDNNVKFNSLGFTDKFPRGAYALKEEEDFVITTLLDVVWQTGKSGKVTPVAILDPVVIGDATISRATLNNIEYIQLLDLEIGCMVKVIRAGEIIPSIVGKL